MKKRKINKWRIKRGVNFHDNMLVGKYCYTAPVSEISMNDIGLRNLELLSKYL